MKNALNIKQAVILVGLFLFFILIPRAESADGFSVQGLVEAWAQVNNMKAKVSGTIGAIKVLEGENVKEGHVLLELENSRENAMLKLAEARLEKARAGIKEAKVVLQNSKKDLERKEIMKEVIPQKEYENARDLVLQYEASILVKEGEIKEGEAEVLLRTAELGNTQIRAPFNGTVTQIHVKAGETVSALNTPICDVVHLDRLYVQVSVPIQYLTMLKKGMKVGIGVERDTPLFAKRFGGEIWYVNPVADPTSRRFKVKVLLRNPNHLVRPGMIVEVFFPSKK